MNFHFLDKKRIIQSVIKLNVIAFIMLCIIFVFNVSAQITITQPAGAGTEVSPYLITSVDNLNWMADQVNNHSNSFAGKWFEQQNDINANISGGSFTPIGQVYPFSGRYDGGGYTISNMYINLLSNSSIGMFGYTDGAHLQYVFLHATIKGREMTGAVVGHCKNSTIVVCYSTGSVQSASGTGGGLVGYSDGSEIKNSYSSSNLSGGGNNTGGLVGYSVNSTIDDCYSIGSNPFSTTATAGGLIGDTSSTTVTNSFWDTETSGQTKSAGGTGLTTAYMKSPTTYAEVDWWYTGWWYMDADFNSGYPYIYLQNPGGTNMLQPVQPSGTGTEADPYLIGDLNNLYWLTKNPDIWDDNAYFKQTVDIDASSTSTWYGGSGFTPIGTNIDNKFYGYYDGNEHIIDGLYISRSGTDYIGFFGFLGAVGGDGNINKLGLTNVNFTGNDYVGGIAGSCYGGGAHIMYCYCTGTVKGENWVGGIAGEMDGYANFHFCYSTVNVITDNTSALAIGGMGGGVYEHGSIDYSYSIGKVIAPSEVSPGGLVGRSYIGYNGTVLHSYWDTQTSGLTNNTPGTAATTGEMKTDTLYENNGWNFDATWARSDDKNGGYPYLQWQTFPNTITFTDAGSYTPEIPTPGEVNQPIGRFALRTSSSGTFDAVWITLYGDFTGVSNYKLWESSDNIFDSSSDILLGTTLSPNLQWEDQIWFTGLFRPLSTSDKYYFLTCDLAEDATGEIKPTLLGSKDLMFGLGALGTPISGIVELANDYNALPVELTSFSAAFVNNGVQLNWETATEVNNYGFEIERKFTELFELNDASTSSASGWTKIGFVAGAGNSNSTKEYSFVDNSKLDGKYQYRLKQIDIDGNYKYSDIVEININSELPNKFELSQNYPNPFNPATVIRYSLPSVAALSAVPAGRQEVEAQHVSLIIYDVLGNEVATLVNENQSAGNYEVTFNASNLSSGIYFYRLQTSSGFIATKKLMLMK